MIGYEGAPRYPQAIVALTGDEEIAPPGLTLETDRPEYSWLKRERLWSLRLNLGAVAANFNKFIIQPAQGTHVLTVVTKIHSDQAAFVEIGEAIVAGGAATFAVARDGRGGFNRRVATAGFTAQAVAQTGSNGYFPLRANVPEDVIFITAANDVNVPNQFAPILINSAAVNVAQTVYILGYERSLRPEEIPEQ